MVDLNGSDVNSFKFADFPRTALDFVFCFKGNVKLHLRNKQSIQIDEVSYVGQFDRPFEIEFSSQLSLFHVRFKVNGIYPLTKIPLGDFLNDHVSLHDLIKGSTKEVYQKMGEVEDALLKIKILEKFLIKIYRESSMDFRLNQGISVIQQNRGMVSIKDLSEELNTSYKNLERWFKAKVGLTPKRFSSITRFKHVLDDIDNSTSPLWMNFVEEYGFHDQSHFIKNFEEFSGLSPDAYYHQKTSV